MLRRKWLYTIFFFSSVPHLRLGLGSAEEPIRNIIHALVYGVLAFVVWSAMSNTGRMRMAKFIVCFAVCTAVAILDELNQGRVVGRISDPLDVLIDSVGVCLALFIISTRKRVRRRI